MIHMFDHSMSRDSHGMPASASGFDRALTRRQFLGRGLIAGASVVSVPLWARMLEAATPAGGPALPDITEFVGQDQAAELLKLAMAKGAGFAEVYGEYTVNTQFTIDEQKLKTVQYGILQGVGIRVIHGDQTGYAYADEFGMDALRDAARVAAEIAQSGTPGTPRPFRVSEAKAPFVLERPEPLFNTDERRIDYARRAEAAARDYDKRIAQVLSFMQDQSRVILVANSDGLWVTDRHFISRLGVGPTAIDGANRQGSFAVAGGQMDTEYYEKVRTPETVGREAAVDAIELLGAEAPKGGSYPVVVGPGWGGVLVHECFGHSLEGDGIRKETSIRAFQLGKPVCADIVDIYDDSTVPNGRGSFKVDDEGTPSQKSHVVEKGILKGYLWDRLNAQLTEHQSTANGRRQSYREFPIPRMTNTYIAAGKDDPEALIGSIKDGLYCKRLGGGSVNPADGSFSFIVTLSYRIENGKLTAPVKGATLTGNAAEAMMKVSGLGNDLEIDTASGTCGKEGQWKPVGVGQPTVKFSEMTVGGTEA